MSTPCKEDPQDCDRRYCEETGRCAERSKTAPAEANCDTPNYCRGVQRCTAMDEKRAQPAPAEQVSAGWNIRAALSRVAK